MLSNSQNASDVDKLQVRKISTNKHLWVRMIMSSNHLERIWKWSHQFASGKNLTSQTLQED